MDASILIEHHLMIRFPPLIPVAIVTFCMRMQTAGADGSEWDQDLRATQIWLMLHLMMWHHPSDPVTSLNLDLIQILYRQEGRCDLF